MTIKTGRYTLGIGATTLVFLFGLGCAKPEVEIPENKPIEVNEPAEKPHKPDDSAKVPLASKDAASPIETNAPAEEHMAFLKASLAETQKLKSLSVNFLRQERLGLLKELKPKEDIIAEHRDEPFSVRFTWNDPKSEYQQCVYVQGKEDNKVLLLPRVGLFGLPPSVQKYPAEFAVTFQKARNPITDFGPRRMMERIIDRIEKARPHGEVQITKLAPTKIGPLNEPCYHFELRYPKGDQYACKLQDLYISMNTMLPVATYLWIPGKVERSDSTLDGMYMYSDLKPNVALSDADFVIETKASSDDKGSKTVSASSGGEPEQSEGRAASSVP